MVKKPLVAIILLTLICIALPAAAQAPADEGWRVTIAPYLMFAGESGTSIVKGHEIDVDAGFSDILENLQGSA